MAITIGIFITGGAIGNILAEKNKEVGFSPIYDSARALLWNKTEESVFKMFEQYKSDSNQIDSYIKRSKPRFSFDENPNANHFELIEYLANYKDTYKEIIRDLASLEKENHIIQQLNILTSCFFSAERCILTEVIIKKRFQILRQTKIINYPFWRHLFPLYYVKKPRRCPASPTFFALSSEKIFSPNVHLLTLICLRNLVL